MGGAAKVLQRRNGTAIGQSVGRSRRQEMRYVLLAGGKMARTESLGDHVGHHDRGARAARVDLVLSERKTKLPKRFAASRAR
jgi:hypothetical protein